MTLTIETGAGVRGANSYIPTAFIDAYLAERGRSEENDWSGLGSAEKIAFAIEGSDYIETRWGPRFKGSREKTFANIFSTGSVTFTGLPVAAELLAIGDFGYVFVSALTGVANEVLIGADAAACATNLDAALRADSDSAGVLFGEGTFPNHHVAPELDGAVINLTATADGTSGDYTPIAGTVTNVTLVAFSGGADGGSQTLSFPRVGLVDRSGQFVLGIPLNLKQAQAEYSVRAAAGSLYHDPSPDELGGNVTRLLEKVGPITTDTEYAPGSTGSGKPIAYPAADRLLAGYVRSGGVIRG